MMETESYQLPPELLDCQPTAGWSLIRPDEKTDMTTGGILLPGGGENQTSIRTGRCVAVGEARVEFGTTIPTRCEVGNTVLYTDQGSVLVHLQGVEHHLVKHAAIFSLVKCAPKKYVKPAPPVKLVAPNGPNGGLPRPIREG